MIGVIKANAYGGVSGPIAEKLVELGIDALAVAYTEEGVQLRQFGIKIPLLVFYPQVESFRNLILHDLEPVLYSKWSWEKFKEALSEEKKSDYPLHIKYNTGLNRIGFRPEEADWILEQLKDSSFNLKPYTAIWHKQKLQNRTRRQKIKFPCLSRSCKSTTGPQNKNLNITY